MPVIVHRNEQLAFVQHRGQKVRIASKNLVDCFWEVVEKFPQERISWCAEHLLEKRDEQAWEKVFQHQLIMASCSLNTRFLPESIGYIDQLPFVNYEKEVQYPTWQMSTDMGGMYAQVARAFKNLLRNIGHFGYLLNAMAKIGQQNGLFCYHAPALANYSSEEPIKILASTSQLFAFSFQHYKSIWTTLLFWCFLYYEKKFPLFAYLKSFRNKKLFQKTVDFSGISIEGKGKENSERQIDVIIPTMGRPAYIVQVLEDLAAQTLLPKKVIVVEQNPQPQAQTQLPEIEGRNWPFSIVHHFIQQTGACNARNLALSQVTSEYIFFADDDIRFPENLLQNAFLEIEKYGISALNMNCLQPNETTVFEKVKQWGSFGAGTSLVASKYALKCHFSEIYEHGYGEDTDFGMQLRRRGCDIVYHPQVKILHLKAPMGGFRKKQQLAWESEQPLPKPSPTLMVYAFSYYTKQQRRGFKMSLFIKFYFRQSEKNPCKYLKMMRKRWKKSEAWAKNLM